MQFFPSLWHLFITRHSLDILIEEVHSELQEQVTKCKIPCFHVQPMHLCRQCKKAVSVNNSTIPTSVSWWISIARSSRKRILRRLCFHRCLSVHRGVSVSVQEGSPSRGVSVWGGLCPGGASVQGVIYARGVSENFALPL